jgi:hypothetical protein
VLCVWCSARMLLANEARCLGSADRDVEEDPCCDDEPHTRVWRRARDPSLNCSAASTSAERARAGKPESASVSWRAARDWLRPFCRRRLSSGLFLRRGVLECLALFRPVLPGRGMAAGYFRPLRPWCVLGPARDCPVKNREFDRSGERRERAGPCWRGPWELGIKVTVVGGSLSLREAASERGRVRCRAGVWWPWGPRDD